MMTKISHTTLPASQIIITISSKIVPTVHVTGVFQTWMRFQNRGLNDPNLAEDYKVEILSDVLKGT
jgi:hypothetical protein